ncbi:MAG: hypothetical protein JWQ29_1471 [Phenylobacterium sp.]|nr:hypothetical protein [Phenylobacterium sp.]
MPSHYANFTAARRRRAASFAQVERPALPGSVIDAVLRIHDEDQDQGSGRTLLRLSKKRLRDAEVAAALGDQKKRAANVSILWNEHESQIIRVLEAA